MREKLISFMRGRYGVDQLGKGTMWFTILLLVINIFLRNPWLNLVTLLLLVWIYFRMFSRNYSKRSRENSFYLQHTVGIRGFFSKRKSRMLLRRTHHIYSCPECRQKIKIPKGRGRIEITCPKCACKFTKVS